MVSDVGGRALAGEEGHGGGALVKSGCGGTRALSPGRAGGTLMVSEKGISREREEDAKEMYNKAAKRSENRRKRMGLREVKPAPIPARHAFRLAEAALNIASIHHVAFVHVGEASH